ncbi:MAG: hypothetical protein FWC62_02770 [Firmicutes bacterium]|nr:hypothetical protein [Bacillota bacterium]
MDQRKYLILRSATAEAIFRLQGITQMLILAQQEAEELIKNLLPVENGEQVSDIP